MGVASRVAMRSIPGGRGRRELPADRGGIANRAFTFSRRRCEPSNRSLLSRHVGWGALSRASQVASARRGVMIEGGATLRGADILYRSVLLPIAEDGVDHALGATNYRLLWEDEPRLRPGIFQTQWI